MKQGYLCDLRAVRVQVAVDLDGVRTHDGDFSEVDLERALADAGAPDHAVRAYREHAPGRKAIVFTPGIELAHEMAEAFEAAGISAAAIDESTPREERASVLRAFRRGEVRVVATLELARAAMEAVAALLRPVDRGLDALLDGAGRTVISGAALVGSPGWCQVVADALGKPVSALHVEEASSRGAAVLALHRLGVAAARALPLERTWRLRPRATAAYQELERRLTSLYQATVASGEFV